MTASMSAPVGACFPLIPGTKDPAISAWPVVGPGVYQPVGSYGIALAADDLVLDGDPRNYPAGRDVLVELLSEFNLTPTRVVKTPRGGWHIYLKKPPSEKIKKQQSAYPGVDFLSFGHYVVGPGTRTVAGKGRVDGEYTLESEGPIKEAPAALLARLERVADAIKAGSGEASLLMAQQFKKDCMAALHAVKGSRGISAYKLACSGKDLGLPLDVVYEHMRDEWAPRCEPPLEDGETYTQVEHAYKYARNTQGCHSPEAKFKPDMAITPTPADTPNASTTGNVVSIDDFQHERIKTTIHQKSLVLDQKTLMPENTLGNVVYLLRHDAAWKGRLFYNQFADRVEIKGRPDWRREQLNKSEGITTYDLAFMQTWFSSEQSIRLEVGKDKLESACFAAATPYHPVKDYLDSVNWDGIPRIDRFLCDTTGCIDNAYTRAAGSCFLIAAVKRIYEPGCKQDYLLVLESMQGMNKSKWVQALGDPWSSVGELVRGDKDTYQNLRGKWVVELPEIDHTFNKQDVAWLKKVITTSSDTYRPSYARVAESVPRESVFIATINPTGSGAYLKDAENRRYWPIKTGELDVELLVANRDQYFAEAKHRYLAGEKSWIDNPEALAIAKKEQELRRERDPWADLLKNWVNAQKGCFSSAEVFIAMGIPAKDISSRHRDRLYSALRELGWDFNREIGGGTWSRVLKWEDLI